MLLISSVNFQSNLKSKQKVNNQNDYYKKSLISEPINDTISFKGNPIPKFVDKTTESVKVLSELLGRDVKITTREKVYAFIENPSTSEIAEILEKTKKSLLKERCDLKKYNNEEEMGEFIEAAYNYNLKAGCTKYPELSIKIEKMHSPEKGLFKAKEQTVLNLRPYEEGSTELYRQDMLTKNIFSSLMEEKLDNKFQKTDSNPFEIINESTGNSFLVKFVHDGPNIYNFAGITVEKIAKSQV